MLRISIAVAFPVFSACRAAGKSQVGTLWPRKAAVEQCGELPAEVRRFPRNYRGNRIEKSPNAPIALSVILIPRSFAAIDLRRDAAPLSFVIVRRCEIHGTEQAGISAPQAHRPLAAAIRDSVAHERCHLNYFKHVGATEWHSCPARRVARLSEAGLDQIGCLTVKSIASKGEVR